MSSTTAAMGSAPSEGSSPFVNDTWGLRLFGPEPYPPFVGEGEFAIINPDFWGASKEEQDAMKGWYVFHAVSSFPFLCRSYIDDIVAIYCRENIPKLQVVKEELLKKLIIA